MSTEIKQAQFLEYRFKNEELFKEWLRSIWSKKIRLVDKGQDMTAMWIHETGEILHCNFHASIYDGRFVDLESLQECSAIRLWNNESLEWDVMNNLVVESITENTELKTI